MYIILRVVATTHEWLTLEHMHSPVQSHLTTIEGNKKRYHTLHVPKPMTGINDPPVPTGTDGTVDGSIL